MNETNNPIAYTSLLRDAINNSPESYDAHRGNYESIIKSLPEERLYSLIETALKKIPEREKEILELRYGLHGETHTLQKVGEQFQISRERVRQIQKKALKHLADQGLEGQLQ